MQSTDVKNGDQQSFASQDVVDKLDELSQNFNKTVKLLVSKQEQEGKSKRNEKMQYLAALIVVIAFAWGIIEGKVENHTNATFEVMKGQVDRIIDSQRDLKISVEIWIVTGKSNHNN